MRLGVPGNVQIVTAHADHDFVLHNNRRDRTVIELVEVADLFVPALASVLDVQRHQVAVRSFVIQPVAINRRASIADVNPAFRLPDVVPDLASRTSVERPHVVRRGQIDDAIHLQRRPFDRAGVAAAARVHSIDPPQTQRADVAVVDLRQRTEPAAGVIAVIAWPRIRAGIQELRGIEPCLSRRCQDGGAHKTASSEHRAFHFSVSR